jgi:hypothetical protein
MEFAIGTVAAPGADEYVAHFHSERNHQGKQNQILFPTRAHNQRGVRPRVRCDERLGGLLKYYTRAA